eukprot:COSAG03_NODE_1541_length_3905_cov_6.605360_3_plen_587_part_00
MFATPTECNVCQVEFARAEPELALVQLQCTHIFCEPCIGRWWSRSPKKSCPCCRAVCAGLRNCPRLTAAEACERARMEQDSAQPVPPAGPPPSAPLGDRLVAVKVEAEAAVRTPRKRGRADKVFKSAPPEDMISQLAMDFRAARDAEHGRTSDTALRGYAQMLPRVCVVFKKMYGDEWDGTDPLAIVDMAKFKAALHQTKGFESMIYGSNSNGPGTPSAALHWYRKVAHCYAVLATGSAGFVRLTFHRVGHRGSYSWEAEWKHPQQPLGEASAGQPTSPAPTESDSPPMPPIDTPGVVLPAEQPRPKCRRTLSFETEAAVQTPRKRGSKRGLRADKVFKSAPPEDMISRLAMDFRAARDAEHGRTSDTALRGYAQMLPRVCVVFKKMYGDEWDGTDPLAIVDMAKFKAALHQTRGSESMIYGNNSNGTGTPSAALHWYRKVAHVYSSFLVTKGEAPGCIQLTFSRNGKWFTWVAEWKAGSDRACKRPRGEEEEEAGEGDALSSEVHAPSAPGRQAASASTVGQPANRPRQRARSHEQPHRELDFSPLGWPELHALCGYLGLEVGASAASKSDIATLIASKVAPTSN